MTFLLDVLKGTVLSTKSFENLKKGLFLGLGLGTTIWTLKVTSKEKPIDLGPIDGDGVFFQDDGERVDKYIFVREDFEVSSALARLESLLVWNTGQKLAYFLVHRLYRLFNLLVGYHLFLLRQSGGNLPIPLHVGYTALELQVDVEETLNKVVSQEYAYPKLGRNVCECAEELEKVTNDIVKAIQSDIKKHIFHGSYI